MNHHFLCAGEALSYILEDEKLEVTPKRIAMRKVDRGCQRFCFGGSVIQFS